MGRTVYPRKCGGEGKKRYAAEFSAGEKMASNKEEDRRLERKTAAIVVRR